MTISAPKFTRRHLLQLSAAAVTAVPFSQVLSDSPPASSSLKYANGRSVPKIGMGTWLTFDVDPDSAASQVRQAVLESFYALGGGMIDSSPMYGRSEEIIGLLNDKLNKPGNMFSATKIWSAFAARGDDQLSDSHRLWQEETLDLVHVHNLLRWKEHLKTLRAAKESGRVRYIGLTTSHGRRHDEMEMLIRTEPVDCVQFSYNILDREAENRLLPAAMDNGVAVVINRPFQTGGLFRHVAGKALPPWADEIGCATWAEFFLKFVVSHPAVTCAIPATRQVEHMKQNMQAGTGHMPDEKLRRKMALYVAT